MTRVAALKLSEAKVWTIGRKIFLDLFEKKGEIAHFVQFLLFPQCFQKLPAAEAKNVVCMTERFITLFHLRTRFDPIAADDF